MTWGDKFNCSGICVTPLFIKKYDVKPYHGYTNKDRLKCRKCEIKLVTNLENCPCCNLRLREVKKCLKASRTFSLPIPRKIRSSTTNPFDMYIDEQTVRQLLRENYYA